MKERFAGFLVTNNRIILIIFIVLALACGALIPFVNVNRDMTKYLPDDSSMRLGLDLMEAEFGEEESSTLKIMFDDLNGADEKLAMKAELEDLSGVESVDYELPDSEDGTDYNRDGHTLYVLNCDLDQYSEEAASLWQEVGERYEESHEIALGGTIDAANHNGLPLWIALSAVALIFLVLLIMANSWIEPVAFLVTVGVAVLINMGTYIFFPSISKTTFGIVAILQLALSMDYSIMLLNRYRQQRLVCEDKHLAMKYALMRSFGAITGSSLTTFAGLLALLFMRFGVGADIGLALAKGVLISLLCIFTVLPAMLLALDSLMLRTPKPTLPFDLPHLSGFQFRGRVPLALLFACLFIAGFMARSGVDFSYAQYGAGDAIEAAFGQDNTIVMMYNEKDSSAAGKLADKLDAREEVRSAVCYESTIGKDRTAEDMKDFIDDMRDESDPDTDFSDTDMSTDMLRLIYYDYYAGDPQFGMTIPRFVSFLQEDVMYDPDFGRTMDDETRDQINDMAKFTDVHALTSQKTASGLASFFGMKTSQARQLLLYYQIKKGSADPGRMTLPRFISFLIDEVATDPDYGSMISASQREQLESMRVYTNKKKMTKKRTYKGAAKLLGMKKPQMRMIYVNHHMKKGVEGTRTIADVAQILQQMSEDPALKDQFGGEETAQLIGALSQIGQMDPTPYEIPAMVQALTGYGIPLDEQPLTLVWAYSDILSDPASHKISVQKLIHYMLSDKTIRHSLTKSQRKQLRTLRKIIDTSVRGKKLSTSSMGKLLGMKKSDVRSIYLLYIYKHGNTDRWTLSPQQFINFLVNTVLSDPDMKGRIGGSAKDLRLAQRLINGAVNGTEYTYHGLSDLLDGYSEDMSEGDLQMLYELYGSRNYYDESWRMDLMKLVSHLDGEMIERPAFSQAMEEDEIEDVHEMRDDLEEAAGKLHGEHYGRLMINADLPEDSDETRAFMDQLTSYTGERFSSPMYLIGATPMAYEMSQTFHSELNRVTLLTALFILFIVLLTFRRFVTSAILVLIIQCAVFLTMAVLNALHIDMNYLALLIVQSIMMGATIDYAIIYTTYYIENRSGAEAASIAGADLAGGTGAASIAEADLAEPVAGAGAAPLSRRESIRAAYKGSLQTILTSATILIAAVGVLSFAFEEPATRQICRILSIGCLIATILVIFLLPGILACLDRFVVKRPCK
ncbi:MAG: MMPL family transporter [Firmicutes bacterium]|nr:MMPL family transporter [Bacillota bacterium]